MESTIPDKQVEFLSTLFTELNSIKKIDAFFSECVNEDKTPILNDILQKIGLDKFEFKIQNSKIWLYWDPNSKFIKNLDNKDTIRATLDPLWNAFSTVVTDKQTEILGKLIVAIDKSNSFFGTNDFEVRKKFAEEKIKEIQVTKVKDPYEEVFEEAIKGEETKDKNLYQGEKKDIESKKPESNKNEIDKEKGKKR